jgi:colicin import membrane protein
VKVVRIAGVLMAWCCSLPVTAQEAASSSTVSAAQASRAKPYSFGYGGRLAAAIKVNIKFPYEIPLQSPVAEVRLFTLPDGTIQNVALSKRSSLKEWDDAVIRAAQMTGKLPLDVDGRIPPEIQLVFSAR